MKRKHIVLSVFVMIFFSLALLFGKVINHYDKNLLTSASEKQDQKIRQLEEIIEEKDDDINTMKSLAWEYLIKHDYDKAIEINEKVIKIAKNDTKAMHQLIIAYMKTEQFEKAKIKSELLLQFNQYNPVALTNLAQIYFLLNDEEEFISTLEQTIEAAEIQNVEGAEADFYRSLYQLKEHYISLKNAGKIAEAYQLISDFESFDELVKIKAMDEFLQVSNTVEPNFYYQKSFHEITVYKLKDAQKTLELLLVKYPDDEYGMLLLSDIMFKNKDFNSLKTLQETFNNKYLESFTDALITFQTDQKTATHQLESLLHDTPNEQRHVILSNLVIMSHVINDERKLKEYRDLYFEMERDVNYEIALSLNRILNPSNPRWELN